MYQIGEFSYLCETTIKTLRYYDKINLLKPARIDKFTGYRYYSEEQIITFGKIKELQELNFSLKEIKELLLTENNEKLKEKQKELEEEFSKKMAILEKMNMNKEFEMITNPKHRCIGINTIIKTRKDIDKILEKVDKIINLSKEYPKIFINYEKGYEEKNIMCFIGRIIPEDIFSSKELQEKWQKKKLYNYNDWVTPTFLKTKVTDNILSTYQRIIEYASKNKIQLRGDFKEITENNETIILVEAYDLTKENEAAIEHNKRLAERLKETTKDSYPEKFIGKWKLEGEITEIPVMFNPKRKHYMPDTELKILELKADGTTNYENITWKESYLIVKYEDVVIYNTLHINKNGRKKYLEVLIQDRKESAARPYRYYYKKIKK